MSASMETAVQSPTWRHLHQGLLVLVPGVACLAILVTQAFLIRRINVNWDEFFFLTHVHALLRGELTGLFQMAYTHLFTWLPLVGDEMAQIAAGRGVMLALLAASVVMIVVLARRWASLSASILAALAFLAVSHVLRHSASFRADSLLLPLLLATLLLVTRPRPSRVSDVLAGVCFGAALAVTIKAVLFAPTLVMLAFLDPGARHTALLLRVRDIVVRWALPVAVAAGVFGAILLLHRLAIPPQAAGEAGGYAVSVARKTLDVPLFLRSSYFIGTLNADIATWLLFGAGAVLAIVRRKWGVVACALSLLPIVFYRNAYPYFYVVMMAPAAVLVATAVDELRAFSHRTRLPKVDWIPLALSVLLVFQAFAHLSRLSVDRQKGQRQIISVVHETFPEPVAYLDHSGMIASFRKVNFFMSTWGMEAYRAGKTGFMREALQRHRPPLLLGNRGAIDPLRGAFRSLKAEDRLLIERFYIPYWGPVWIAGRQVQVSRGGEVVADLPFPGRYRVTSRRPVLIDGVLRNKGDIVEITDADCVVALPAGESRPAMITLVSAEARLTRRESPQDLEIYAPLM
jgi:hypothetical protein